MTSSRVIRESYDAATGVSPVHPCACSRYRGALHYQAISVLAERPAAQKARWELPVATSSVPVSLLKART